ncbi:protein translocase subunit SecF [Salicibibacter kimchii]|uniref:Protein-export membrane protein SecF n=1 Tax=Salicibibacter kimchii TaxID=2099786 RepID=A0A345C4D5_9BACI|nr:protein translocase subunit SecF [Salicibibacter kimchii]AXF58066.1 protein translocase subunit SecF [Salicibibacter kimchii]
MDFNFANKNIDLIKHRKTYFFITIAVVLAGAILLSTLGLNLGIDFSSGTRVDFMSEEPLTAEEIENEFAEIGLSPDDITLAGDDHEQASAQFIGDLSQDEQLNIQGHLEEAFGYEPNVSYVSPQIGRELAINALIATGFASLGIVIYVAIRFEFLYGLAAITALLYDAFLVISIFSLLQLEINIPFIAAVLTVIGYSINDTIVTFDRIRENVRKEEEEEEIKDFNRLAGIVNKSLLQTLTRSINTVLTVLFAAGAIWLLGSEAITSFAIAIVIGLVAGTYSSLFFAAQLWLVWKNKYIKKQQEKPTTEMEGSEP